MFHLQQGEGEGDQTSSLNPSYEPNENTKATDFNFWEDRIREGYENHEDDDNYTAYSPPMWSRNAAKEAPLVKYTHNSSYPSPNSRFQTILEGRRKELMEIPELSYELSLRDIVSDEEKVVQKGMIVHEQEKIVVTSQAKPKARRKKISHKRGQILRSESMDSGVFMLKMFLPATCCLCSSTKGLKRNVSSQVVRSPSFDGFLKAVNTDWWKFRLLPENKNSSSSSRSGSSGSISSTGSRDAENEVKVKPGCWSFNMECIPKRQSGCLF